MDREESSENMENMGMLCLTAKELINSRDYAQCEALIRSAMGKHPHAPQPHNLMGIMLEKNGDHLTAMKHFRAASALDPAYIPAWQNLDCYGTFFSGGKCAYDESDCTEKAEERRADKADGNARGAGRLTRRD
jgi:Tfp pilus assembly protein PilF